MTIRAITTAVSWLAQSYSTWLGRFLFRGRRPLASHQTSRSLTPLQLRLHFCFVYLRTLKQELRNVYHRMGILRDRHLCQTGISLLSISEQCRLSHRHQNRLLCARRLGIQKLLTILPEASLVDLHLVVELFRPCLFAEDGDSERSLLSRETTCPKV